MIGSLKPDLLKGNEGKFPLVIRGSSMLPFFKSGDILIIKQMPPESLKPGNIVVHRDFQGLDIVHRLRRICKDQSGLSFITRGDNMKYPDRMFFSDDLKGKVTGKYQNGKFRTITRTEELATMITAGLFIKIKEFLYLFFRLALPLFVKFLPVKWKTMNGKNKGDMRVAFFLGRVIAKYKKEGSKNLLWVHPVFKGFIDIHHIK